MAIKLPASLASRQSPAGFHHFGIKTLFYGGPKTGKSFALASFPHPIFALACGENGIEQYLKPELGDISVFVDDPKSYMGALEFALAHPEVNSIVVDNINLAFEDWMTAWEDDLGVEEIKGGNWRKVKGPWKALHRKVMHSHKNFGCSAWPRGAKYLQETVSSNMPGVEAKTKLVILEQDSPHVEKMIPFAVDMYFKTDIELNKLFAPTSIHKITYQGGRRPNSIPANELFAGKFWKFDASKVDEVSPFDRVLKPIIDKWKDGATSYEGLDPKEASRELGEAQTALDDQEVGRLIASFAKVRDGAELLKLWNENSKVINELPPDKKVHVIEAKEAAKKECGM